MCEQMKNKSVNVRTNKNRIVNVRTNKNRTVNVKTQETNVICMKNDKQTFQCFVKIHQFTCISHGKIGVKQICFKS